MTDQQQPEQNQREEFYQPPMAFLWFLFGTLVGASASILLLLMLSFNNDKSQKNFGRNVAICSTVCGFTAAIVSFFYCAKNDSSHTNHDMISGSYRRTSNIQHID